MTSRYVPPHLRPGHVTTVITAVTKRRGVHFPSEKTGLPTSDEQWYRFGEGFPVVTPRTAFLAKSKQPKKSALRKKTVAKKKASARKTKSASPRQLNKTLKQKKPLSK